MEVASWSSPQSRKLLCRGLSKRLLPAHVVPGIGFSPDRFLQAGCFPTATPIVTV
jgi:hypothetical protein